MNENATLKEKILGEMVIDHADALEKNFEIAKQFVQITKSGKVNLIAKEKFTSKEQIQLYLVGRIYAKEGGLTSDMCVDRTELSSELGLPIGTVDPKLKELVDEKIIEKDKDSSTAKYYILLSRVEKILKDTQQKIKVKNDKGNK